MRAMHDKIFLVKTLIIDDRPFVNLPEKKTSRWSETRVTDAIHGSGLVNSPLPGSAADFGPIFIGRRRAPSLRM